MFIKYSRLMEGTKCPKPVCRQVGRLFFKAITIGLAYLLLFNDIAFGLTDRSTLAPSLATQAQAFRNDWAFVQISYRICDILKLAQEQKLQNPKEILIPLINQIKQALRNEKILFKKVLEEFDINGIKEVREGGEITGFILPYKRDEVRLYNFVYNLEGGDISLPIIAGWKRVYVRIDSVEDTRRVVSVEKETSPALLDKGLTLIAVHAGYVEERSGDTNEVVLEPAKRILEELRFDHIYEHIGSLYPSYLSRHHQGILVNDSPYPLSYSIPNLRGDHFVIIGGGFEYCHYKAFCRLLDQIKMGLPNHRHNRPIVIDIPVFALYWNVIDGDSGEIYMTSAGVGIDADFKFYLTALKNSGLKYKAVKIRGKGPELLDNNSEHPSIVVRIVDSLETFVKERAPRPSTPLSTTISAESEKIHATNFQDMIKFIRAKPQTQPIIVALGTSWIKGYEKRQSQYNVLNPFISFLRNYCEERKILFVAGEDDKLPALIDKEKEQRGMPPGTKTVMLAGVDKDGAPVEAIRKLMQNEIYTIVGVNGQELTANSYIRLMEMLTIALKISAGLQPSLDNEHIIILPPNATCPIYILIPHAEKMSVPERRVIYEVQRYA